jgi:hypothetical protein
MKLERKRKTEKCSDLLNPYEQTRLYSAAPQALS